MKFLKITFAVLFTIVLLVFFIGAFAPKAHHCEISGDFDCSKQKLWTVLNDINDLPKRRKEIKNVELLGTSENGLRKWKQYTIMGGCMLLETIEVKPLEELTIKITESTFGIRGTLNYRLTAIDTASCTLTIIEDSEIDKMPLRSLITILGRNANVKKEMNTLKIATEEDILGLGMEIENPLQNPLKN